MDRILYHKIGIRTTSLTLKGGSLKIVLSHSLSHSDITLRAKVNNEDSIHMYISGRHHMTYIHTYLA